MKHAHYYWLRFLESGGLHRSPNTGLLLAEGQLTRQRFGSMLRRIAALPLPNGSTPERVANQERQRIERSEAILWGEVSATRLVGGEKQTKPVSGTVKRAGRRGDPPNRGQSLTREGRWAYGFAQRQS